jgi:hypothetical protein
MPEACFLLVKTDTAGQVEWSKAYAPDNPYDPGEYCVANEGSALQVTSDGGYMALGSSYVGGYHLASILKTDADGNQEFFKVINDNAKAYEQVMVAGQQTQDGGYVLCGHSSNGAPHGYMALLIKVDAAGDLVWSKTYQYEAGDHGAEAYGVTQTADGGYLLGGLLINDITKVSTYGPWIAKVDLNGDVVWMRAYGNTTVHYPTAFEETPQGDFVVAGAASAGPMMLAKFTAAGNLLWNFSDDELPNTTGRALTLTGDGGCMVVGSGISGGTLIFKVNNVYAVD